LLCLKQGIYGHLKQAEVFIYTLLPRREAE